MIEKFFSLKENNSNIKTEIIAGITTFISSMYIIVVNPMILSNGGMSFSAVLTGTIILSAFCTILMGLYAKNPILVAPGMGLNAFFTFTVIIGMKVKPEIALGAAFWSGVLFFLLSIFNIRTLIVEAIPKQIRFAIACGIGLFISLIGFENAKFIIQNSATLVTIGKLDFSMITFLIG